MSKENACPACGQNNAMLFKEKTKAGVTVDECRNCGYQALTKFESSGMAKHVNGQPWDANCFACGEKIDFEDPNIEYRTNRHVTCGCSDSYSGVTEKMLEERGAESFVAAFFREKPDHVNCWQYPCCGHTATWGQFVQYGDKCPRCGTEAKAVKHEREPQFKVVTEKCDYCGRSSDIGRTTADGRKACESVGCQALADKVDEMMTASPVFRSGEPTSPVTFAECKELVLRRGLTLETLINVVVEVNGVCGVGFITLKQMVDSYIDAAEKRKGERSLESWMND